MYWLSISIGIIGFLMTAFALFWSVKGRDIMDKRREKKAVKASELSNELLIAGEWQSVFIEANKVCNEKIAVNQVGSNITARFSTIDKNAHRFDFNGTFTNNILTGEYTASHKNRDERGGIFLKRISEHILAGHCIFIYKSREIYNSPYVWVKNDYMNITRGTYPFCTSCIGGSACCCDNPEIDMPILMPHEVNEILLNTKKPIKDFCEKKTDNIFQMKRSEAGSCVFFVGNRCSIYDVRPVDCRLFPFDVYLFNGRYIIGYYPLACSRIPREKEEIELFVHHIKPLLSLMSPYLSESTNPILSEKVSQLEFIELEPLDNSLKS